MKEVNVGDTFIVMSQHCGLDLPTITEAKNMDQGKEGKYIHTGDVIGVVMETAKGELTFILNETNISATYEEISLDKPLIPCILIGYEGDSIELLI